MVGKILKGFSLWHRVLAYASIADMVLPIVSVQVAREQVQQWVNSAGLFIAYCKHMKVGMQYRRLLAHYTTAKFFEWV